VAETRYNESEFDYRREEGANQSSLKKILESPAHYQATLKFKMIPTPAMEIGTALHCLTLDGQKAFDAQYVKKPDGLSLATKEGRKWKADLGNKKPLAEGGKDDPWGSVQGMGYSLRELAYFDPSQPDYIKYNEVSIYWDWEGVRCKARLDRIDVENGLVLDLKTTDSVEPELFTKKVVGLGYDFQAAYYAKAAEVAFGKKFDFIFAAVERKAPYTVDLFQVDEEMMAEGTAKCVAALRLFKDCNEMGEWPNRPATIRRLSYPSWYTPYGQPRVQEEEAGLF
jgi:hypothetical protein